MSPKSLAIPIHAADGHCWQLLARIPDKPVARLLWLPALGVGARHYEPLAEALAEHGVATFLHEWRGNGSSSLRPSRTLDWGYRELLELDLPASRAAMTPAVEDGESVIGGHSLGGQLACCFAGLMPACHARIWLVASGTPFWRSFPPPVRYALPLIYRFLPWLARHQGMLHGHRLGFGGTEARTLIADWARVGLSNCYAAKDMAGDLEAGMARITSPATAIVFEHDWLAPPGSMQALLAKMPAAGSHLERLSSYALGVRDDHFAWMKSPSVVAERLCRSLPASPSPQRD